ncbi:MarR family winged helix-turn-helix transcriptional regulator [Aquabacterium sp.]|uniref:MarR family winged helix-turn-helix transcriptional regulator n=1 Tax=Aquabacterium sp. TaxID=1872578 RepID=UPI002BC02100|nr:MarR family transcriptional regulator [Aquabacterium sp.]HSW05897.1 MarR family transcriptional regulator [Aquabacterium sp.]
MRKSKTPAVVPPKKPGNASRKPLKLPADGGNSADFDLEIALPYLLARAGTRMGQAFSKEIRRFDISLTEWRVFAALHHAPHQRLSQLAEHTSAEPSTLSRVVDGLLQRGLLVRDRSDEDARALALSLTEAGRDLTLRIIPLAQLFERVSLAGLSSAQADALRGMLRTVYVNLAVLDSSDP